jgi:ribonuclease HI
MLEVELKRPPIPKVHKVFLLADDPRLGRMVGDLHRSKEDAFAAKRRLSDSGQHLKVYPALLTVHPQPVEERPEDIAPSSLDGADVAIYTDGSITKNPGGYGGWAAVIVWIADGQRQTAEISGGIPKPATNNIAEMTAVIKGLTWVRENLDTHKTIKVVSDSEYVLKGITEWIEGWKRRGWLNSQGNPVANRPLWEEMYRLSHGLFIKWSWVKGHAGHPENERADQLAGIAAKAIRHSSESIEALSSSDA